MKLQSDFVNSKTKSSVKFNNCREETAKPQRKTKKKRDKVELMFNPTQEGQILKSEKESLFKTQFKDNCVGKELNSSSGLFKPPKINYDESTKLTFEEFCSKYDQNETIEGKNISKENMKIIEGMSAEDLIEAKQEIALKIPKKLINKVKSKYEGKTGKSGKIDYTNSNFNFLEEKQFTKEELCSMLMSSLNSQVNFALDSFIHNGTATQDLLNNLLHLCHSTFETTRNKAFVLIKHILKDEINVIERIIEQLSEGNLIFNVNTIDLDLTLIESLEEQNMIELCDLICHRADILGNKRIFNVLIKNKRDKAISVGCLRNRAAIYEYDSEDKTFNLVKSIYKGSCNFGKSLEIDTRIISSEENDQMQNEIIERILRNESISYIEVRYLYYWLKLKNKSIKEVEALNECLNSKIEGPNYFAYWSLKLLRLTQKRPEIIKFKPFKLNCDQIRFKDFLVKTVDLKEQNHILVEIGLLLLKTNNLDCSKEFLFYSSSLLRAGDEYILNKLIDSVMVYCKKREIEEIKVFLHSNEDSKKSQLLRNIYSHTEGIFNNLLEKPKSKYLPFSSNMFLKVLNSDQISTEMKVIAITALTNILPNSLDDSQFLYIITLILRKCSSEEFTNLSVLFFSLFKLSFSGRINIQVVETNDFLGAFESLIDIHSTLLDDVLTVYLTRLAINILLSNDPKVKGVAEIIFERRLNSLVYSKYLLQEEIDPKLNEILLAKNLLNKAAFDYLLRPMKSTNPFIYLHNKLSKYSDLREYFN